MLVTFWLYQTNHIACLLQKKTFYTHIWKNKSGFSKFENFIWSNGKKYFLGVNYKFKYDQGNDQNWSVDIDWERVKNDWNKLLSQLLKDY